VIYEIIQQGSSYFFFFWLNKGYKRKGSAKMTASDKFFTLVVSSLSCSQSELMCCKAYLIWTLFPLEIAFEMTRATVFLILTSTCVSNFTMRGIILWLTISWMQSLVPAVIYDSAQHTSSIPFLSLYSRRLANVRIIILIREKSGRGSQ